MNTNRCRQACPLFHDEQACKKIRKDMNCYQCELTEVVSLRKTVSDLRIKVSELDRENYKLKRALTDKIADTILKEYDKEFAEDTP